jgi:hypothetical protein
LFILQILLLEIANEDADFVSRVLWTDESHFAQMRIVNTHNKHHWAQDRQHQVHSSLIVWVGDCIIGPHLLPEHLTAATYYAFIDEALPGLLEHIPLATRTHVVLARRSTSTPQETFVSSSAIQVASLLQFALVLFIVFL